MLITPLAMIPGALVPTPVSGANGPLTAGLTGMVIASGMFIANPKAVIDCVPTLTSSTSRFGVEAEFFTTTICGLTGSGSAGFEYCSRSEGLCTLTVTALLADPPPLVAVSV